MLRERIIKSFGLLITLLLVRDVWSFVNSPKIITKDGNLIFESGMNRNITFRLTGKSRLTINDQFDLVDLILLRKRIRNSTANSGTIEGGDITWLSGDEASQQQMISEVTALRTRVFGPHGIQSRVLELENRTTTATQNLRRFQTRLQQIETRVQTLFTRLELDSCKSNPCENGGTCFNLFNGFMCKCTKNFEGPTCQQDVNECALFAGTDLGCKNGGLCVNQFGGYNCICSSGWFGIHCTQRKGDCLQSSAWELCGHGTCVPAAANDNFGYKCICDVGWKTNGLTPSCTVDVDECTESHPPCATKCINVPGSFTCAPCPVGLEGSGVNCRDVDECERNNGGCSLSPRVPCINTYGSYHCGECPLGWSGNGRTCTRSTTAENGVQNARCTDGNVCYPGATCNEISNTVVCTCPPGMVGTGLGINGCIAGTTKNCGSFPCLNGGTCIDSADSYICMCPMGFRQPNCAPLPTPCVPNPCHNNARCVPVGGNTFQCQCPPGFSGRLCNGQFSRCGGVLTGLTGRLKYPEASQYEHNSQCAWLVRTNETMVLNVTFSAFDLEDSTECRFDWLQINDGRTAAAQVIGRFCGANKPLGGNVISSSNYLYLWFRSDNSTSREGFDLEWNSIPPQCGGIVEIESHGSIATPGSPGAYPKNRDCIWQLRAPNNKRIKLTFFSMQIENHASCNFDYVTISDTISGTEIQKFCNSSHPAPLLLPTNEATVHFHSDNVDADTGFQIYYSLEERVPGCGGTFTAKEGIIRSPRLTGEPISCEYDIKMSYMTESITIEFTKFNLTDNDCIEFYDVNQDKGTRDLQSKYCGGYDFVPSVFHSLYNAVRIKYFARGGEFELNYKADCSYTYESENDTIYSPGYPNLTKVERFCTYKILTEPNTVISLNVADFELRDSSLEDNDCVYTYLRINDGPDQKLLGPFCNDAEPPKDYVSKSNMITMIFESGATSSGRGFKIEYRAIPMKDTDCGGVFTKPNYSIRLPKNDNGVYLDNLECYFVIMAPQGKAISINWKSFELEDTYDCSSDFIEIYDNLASSAEAKPLGRYCHIRPPPSFVSHSRLLTIKFVSDYSESGSGFEAAYSFVDIASACGGEIFSSSGKLYSPGWPSNYTSGLNCTWIITVPDGTQLELLVVMFELEPERDRECINDWLEIRNGGSANSSLVGKFCGRNIPSAVPSFTNQLYISFHSDNFLSARGFEFTWTTLSNGCGGNLHSKTGIITSPMYPNSYPNDASCEWLIVVNKGSAIHITLEDVSIEELFQCAYDYMEIFDGKTEGDKKLAKICRLDENKKHFVTNNSEALIRFQTDSSSVYRGFYLSFYAVCNRTITAMHGTIESPNINDPESMEDVNCIWTLKAPKGNTIKLELTYFDNTEKTSIYLQDITKNGTTTRAVKELQQYHSIGETLNIIQNSSSVTFRLEYSMFGCIQSFHRDTGEFQSPNYPKTYPNDVECMWDIRVPVGKGIEITIENMDIEEAVNCTKDGLLISNEEHSTHPKERHCGKEDKLVVTSSGHRMFVHFYSDGSHNGKGFKATYKTINTTCGGTIRAKNGVVTSPNYPLDYPLNVYCEWTITVPLHHSIKLTFDELDVEDYYDCDMDYVEGYDGALMDEDDDEAGQLFKRCGSLGEDEAPYRTVSNKATIRFNSDDSSTLKGFKIRFEEQCGERIIIEDDDFQYIEIEKHAPSNETCIWHLIAKDVSKHVDFTPTHVQITPLLGASYSTESDCMEHGIKIYDGVDDKAPLRSKFCKVHPPSITSNGHALTIVVPFNVITEFEGSYSITDGWCSGYYHGITGKISTPYYPSTYPVDVDCTWYIEASAGNSLILTFQTMDLEDSDECNNDYVEIREGYSDGKFLGAFCGKNVPPPVVAHKELWIKFRSNDDNVGSGFIATYSYAQHNEISGSNGTIESPRYPSKFHVDEPYTWRITVEKDYVVLLSIKHIVDVDIPHIKFYDGYSDIGVEIDYSTSHVITSNTNILYFTATRGPFQFEWESLGKDAVRANRTAEENSKSCGNKLVWVKNAVSFMSPGYPSGYENNLNCSWFILPENSAAHATISFLTVDLEEFVDCFADYVAVSSSNDLQNWKLLDKFCKKESNKEKHFDGTPYLKVDFVTDVSNNKTGFSSSLNKECGSELRDPRGFIDISGIATDSNYFQMNCTWKITVRQGRRVRIVFTESTFRNPNNTITADCRSYFLIRNGIDADSPFLGQGRYCENGITDELVTTSNHAYIKFYRIGYPQFKAAFRYEELAHECSDEFTLTDTPSGRMRTISSPNYPNIPNPHTECVWKITAPMNHRIAIDFVGNFDLTPGSKTPAECDHEFLQLNEGATELLPMIGRFCGKTKPDTQYTASNVLRFKYFTDVAEPKIGFSAQVSIASCGGFYYANDGVIESSTNIIPRNKKGDLDCVYTFKAADDGFVEVDINMKLGTSQNCSLVSHLELQEVEAHGLTEVVTDTRKLCGEVVQRFYVETNTLVIHYRSKDQSYETDNFTITYKNLGTRCGETITATSGVLQTPGYPNGVRFATHCVWKLLVPKGRRIKIEFLDFDTGTNNSTQRSPQTFRGRIAFANDFHIQSIIARVTENPPNFIYSTDNTMTIDAFLLPFGNHRGFKLRFSSNEDSLECRPRFSDFYDTTLEFRGNMSSETYCSYLLKPEPNTTLAITIESFTRSGSGYMGNFLCRIFAPLVLYIKKDRLLHDMFCNNATFPQTVRIPYPITLELVGNARNKLDQMNIKPKVFKCGGIVPFTAYYMNENTTITQPRMEDDFKGRIECAWALWPTDSTEVEDWDDVMMWSDEFQVEVALTTNFTGKCEDQYLLLYNGPNQNSPQLGRYCGVSAVSNIIAEHGLFVEYYSSNYEKQSVFNLTALPGSGCGGTITYPYRKLEFDRLYYKNNVECVWELQTEPGFHFGLVFQDRFFIESSPNCKKDYLKIQQRESSESEWVDLAKLCGRQTPATMNTTTTQLRLIFRSDNNTVGDGFSIRFERNCGGLFHVTSANKEMSSPGWPVAMPHNLYCNYTFISPDEGKKGVLIRFTAFNMEAPPISTCLFDNVTVIYETINGNVEKVLCGVQAKREYRSIGPLSIIVQTDPTFPSRGFTLSYSNILCGGDITNSTIVESPHQSDDGNFPPSSNCIWNITAPEDKKILIKFEALDFESLQECSYDSVEVYMGQAVVSDQRVAKFCGNMTSQLPVLHVPSNKALIRSHSDERDPSKGFKALVTFKPNCDRVIYLGTQNSTYQFTKFSQKYDNNLDCGYTFKTVPGRQFKVEFSSFHVEEATGCTADYLKVHDGAGPFADEIGRFCGHVIPTQIITSTHALYMHFVTDSDDTSTGFEALITSIELACGNHDISIAEGVKTVIKSPDDGSGSYMKNINCYWKVSATGNIHIKFDKLDIQDSVGNETCTGNYLKIYNEEDGEWIEKGYGTDLILNGHTKGVDYMNFASEHIYCSKYVPDDYISNSKKVFIKFKSNEHGTGSGFSLTASATVGCYKNYTGTQGRIYISESNDYCDIYIVSPTKHSLALYFGLTTFGEYDCNAEYIEVFDAHTNSSLKKICNYVEPGKSVFSNTNELRLRIKTNTYYTTFDITYLASLDGPGCGGDLYNTVGTLTSPFYPDSLRNNSDCRWNIRVPGNQHVFLRFDVFDLGAKQTCHSDYFQIIEHENDGRERIVRQFCGGDAPKSYKSEKSYLTVRFHKSMNYDGTGWALRFNGVYSNYKIPSYFLGD